MGSFATAGMRSGGILPGGFQEQSNDYHNFVIREIFYENYYTVCRIKYPDSENPDKILVYEGDYIEELRVATKIDPHFTVYNLRLVARFRDTAAGRRALRRFTYGV